MQKAAMIVVVILAVTPCIRGSDLPGFPFICTAGQASVEVVPDVVTISFAVVHSDSDSEKGIQALQEKSRAIVGLMNEFDIPAEDAHASDIQKEEVREELENFQLGKITGYEFSRQFTFQLKNMDLRQKVTRKLLETDSVVGVSTHFDVTSRKEKEQQLMASAIADARERAERMAKGAGAKLGTVYALSEADLTALNDYFLRPPMGPRGSTTSARGVMGGMGGMGGADDVIEAMARPPIIRLGASIRALFRIEPDSGS